MIELLADSSHRPELEVRPVNALDDNLPGSSGLPEHGGKRPFGPGDDLTAAIVSFCANSRHGDKTFRLVCLIPVREVLDGDNTLPVEALGDEPRSKPVIPVDGSLP